MTAPALTPIEAMDRIRRLVPELAEMKAQMTDPDATRKARDEATRAYVAGVDEMVDLMDMLSERGVLRECAEMIAFVYGGAA